MTVEIQVPVLGESLNTATVARWLKKPGDYVQAGEIIVELETDKVTLDVPAPASGQLQKGRSEGEDVEVGHVLATIDETATAPAPPKKAEKTVADKAEAPPPAQKAHSAPQKAPERPVEDKTPSAPVPPVPPSEGERRVPMSRLRKTVARNLKEAQNTAALLTTFNEVDMTAVRELRALYRDKFAEKHEGTRLGFMSFFAKAVTGALKDYPALNARIDGDEVVYRDHVNLGIAVGTERGLVVPVLRQAETMSFASIERQVADYGKRARSGNLALEELSGGSFTITNGGIFGSLLSTPIVNGPQSGVLGMHAIQERPVARHGEVVIRPMMYVALTYDHRLVDGREAVSFLVRLKELLEDPRRLLLDL